MTVATAPATLEERVQGWAKDLCNALDLNYKKQAIRHHERSLADEIHYSPYHEEQLAAIEDGTANLNKFVSYAGKRYHKIIMQEYGRRGEGYQDSTVHAFIDKKTGEVFKPAGWQGPAKHVRYNLLEENSYNECLFKASWAGGYLYMR